MVSLLWRVVRIATIAMFGGFAANGISDTLTPEQLVSLTGLLAGSGEAIYRHFLPHGSTFTAEQLRAMILEAIEQLDTKKQSGGTGE